MGRGGRTRGVRDGILPTTSMEVRSKRGKRGSWEAAHLS